MGLNPNDQADFMKIRDNVLASRKKLEPFRDRHKEGVKKYVGFDYSDDGADKPMDVNLMALTVEVYGRSLVARTPQVTVFTKNKRNRPHGLKLESLMNERLRRGTVQRELSRVVRSALFSMGIMKVGLRETGETEVEGLPFATTDPFMKQILLDDWVHDMSYFRLEDAAFEGHRYEIILEQAEERDDFDKEMRQKLAPIERTNYNEAGDSRLRTLSQGTGHGGSSLHEKTELWEIFLREEQLLVTMTMDGPNRKPLKVVDWEGPDHGPFHKIVFEEVDGNSMGLPPASKWYGLNEQANGIWRKLERQAHASKRFGTVRPEDADSDGELTRTISDGELGVFDNPDAVQEKFIGGIDNKNMAFFMQTLEMFSWLTGVEILGGLSPQSRTVGQDQMLQASASQRMSGMQDEVVRFTQQVLTDYGYWLWTDPLQTYEVNMQFEDLGEMDLTLDPETRQTHQYYEHVIDVEPFSMRHQSPEQRFASIMEIVQGLVLPALPLMQQQGLGIDMAELMRLAGKYRNLPELKDLIVQIQQQQGGGGGGAPSERPLQSPVTQRTNIRQDAGNGQNRVQDMISQLMGGQNA
jgi:hypothetical protein